MIPSKKRLWLCRVLLILNLLFIWGNSMLPGELSGAFSDWVKELLLQFLPVGSMERPESGGLLRKLAHFTEFMSLGLLLSWLFAMGRRNWTMALIWGATAACIDETIQIFVPQRGPSLRDVGIDTLGVITGIILLHLGYLLWKRKQFKQYGGNTQ